ncbi:MAG: septum formation initiator family protein [Patescibacteria group bacterium]|nr:septum formation initiator family protein [Patescibacteria group bacterium]
MNKKSKNSSKNSAFRSLVYVFVAILLLAVLLYITYRLSNKVYRQNQINTEIMKLQTEITNLNQENQDLNELIGYLQTDEFREKEAKDKLNLIKEGERLVLVKENEMQIEQMNKENAQKQAEIVVHHENYYWWWHYFFSLSGK